MMVSFSLIGVFGILPLLLQNCLPSGSADFTASAALQNICGSTLQLHALRLAYSANSTLAKFRYQLILNVIMPLFFTAEAPQYDLPDLPQRNGLRIPQGGRGRQDLRDFFVKLLQRDQGTH